jgi:hypothetical protein
VWLIGLYVAFIFIGNIATYLISRVVEDFWPVASLPVCLLLYFLTLWIAWVLAVRLTEPKPGATQDAAAA